MVDVTPACGKTISVGVAKGCAFAMYCTGVGVFVGVFVGAVQTQLDAYGQLELTQRLTPLTFMQVRPFEQFAFDEQVSWQPTIGIGVFVAVGVLVGVLVGVADGFGVVVDVGVGVFVAVGVGVVVGIGVFVGVGVGVIVGVGAVQQTSGAVAAVASRHAV